MSRRQSSQLGVSTQLWGVSFIWCRVKIDYRSLSCTRIDRIPLSSESLISVVSRLYGCTVWLLYGTGTVMYGYCMVLTTVWYCMVLFGYSCTAVLYGTVLVLYGYCMVPVLLYGCMVLYGCTAVWYCTYSTVWPAAVFKTVFWLQAACLRCCQPWLCAWLVAAWLYR